MTKEQEAIEKCKEIIQQNKEIVKQARLSKDTNAIELTANCNKESIAIETVLNMLKEKGTEINKYKRKNKELSIQLLKIYKEQDNYNARIEKKDKMIDLLIDYIDTLSEYYTRAEGKNNEFCDEKCIDKNIDCYDCIKQYFERKVENGG